MSVDNNFWRQTWAEMKIGFHEGAPNQYLARFPDKLHGRVLVPLCGKTEDLAYLASRGHEVIGVELVEDAVAAFFAEHHLEPAIEDAGTHRVYRAGTVTVLAGDWFAVTPALCGQVDSVYDRAAMVALPPDLRSRYVAHLKSLVAPGTPGLLVTIDYPQERFEGPPFAVPHAEVLACYPGAEQLGEAPFSAGRIAEANVGAVDRCYAITIG